MGLIVTEVLAWLSGLLRKIAVRLPARLTSSHWLPGLVTVDKGLVSLLLAAGCGSGLHFYARSGHCQYIPSLISVLETIGFCPDVILPFILFSVPIWRMWAYILNPLGWWVSSGFPFVLSSQEPLLCSVYSIIPQFDCP